MNQSQPVEATNSSVPNYRVRRAVAGTLAAGLALLGAGEVVNIGENVVRSGINQVADYNQSYLESLLSHPGAVGKLETQYNGSLPDNVEVHTITPLDSNVQSVEQTMGVNANNPADVSLATRELNGQLGSQPLADLIGKQVVLQAGVLNPNVVQ